MQIPETPKWWHMHGMKMDIQRGNRGVVASLGNTLVIGNNVARLQILEPIGDLFKVYWQIQHMNGDVEGQVKMTAEQLEIAFGIKAPFNSCGIAEVFRADAGVQGLYIRTGDFLNVPMPGTALDGDPNISIFITTKIRNAVREFLKG